MKRIVAVKHADGRNEAVCPKCDTKFTWITTNPFNPLESDEFYGCPNCGYKAKPPRVEYETLEDELLYNWPSDWPVFDGSKDPYPRCPVCGSLGKCIVNKKMIDVQVWIMSCTECDSFWRILGP